jgi:hypothetical protein
MPSSNGSLLIIIIPKAKYKCHMVTMLLLYILQKYTLTNVVYFSNTFPHIRFQDPTFSHISVAPISQVCTATTLILRAENHKIYKHGFNITTWHVLEL